MTLLTLLVVFALRVGLLTAVVVVGECHLLSLASVLFWMLSSPVFDDEFEERRSLLFVCTRWEYGFYGSYEF